jgi:probable O-glycosylation ligase (exosortase A-associated)
VSIRDLALAMVIAVSLPVSLLRPWIGILVWSWLGYMNPHRLTWGFTRDWPFAQVVAIVTLGGLLFTKERAPLPRTREVSLLFLLWTIFLFSTLFAAYPDAAWEQLAKVSKILLMTFVTLVLFQDPTKLRMLLYVIALSIGFFGLKGGIWSLMTGGEYKVLGPPESFIAGNTEIGLALNMVLPILFFLRREEHRQWLRHLLLAVFLFSIIAVLITYSRGALLGLLAVLTMLFFKSRAKVLVIPLLALGLVLAPFLLPEKWFGRMETIQTYEEDRSALGRIVAWKLSYRMALDRPILGFGFRPFTPEVYYHYMPEVEYTYEAARSADAHNIFFQVLAEHGFTGLAIYVWLILSTLGSLRGTIRTTRDDPSASQIHHYAQMIEAGLVVFLVNGFFLSRSYFDLFYHFVAIAIILKSLANVRESQLTDSSEPTLAEPGVMGGQAG